MTPSIRTGDLGLDLLLGGGWRLLTRFGDRRSSTVLVRGGAGAGKTLFGLHAALGLAKELGGDVAVGCVEILPSEYGAQVLSSRRDIPEAAVVVLPRTTQHRATTRIFCGLLTDLDPNEPDLVASLEALARDVESAGGKPVVFVVDSLIEGYGLGASAARTSADAVMKFAAHGGYALVFCEESQDSGASPWQFAADTVIEVGVEAHERGRWIEVRKHRFGPSVSGRHELELGGQAAPSVYPEPHAWVTPHRQDVLSRHGFGFGDGRGMSALVWDSALQSTPQQQPIEGALVLVTNPDAGLARDTAAALCPSGNDSPRTLMIELDPLILHETETSSDVMEVLHVPTVHGPARALRAFVRKFAQAIEQQPPIMPVRRVLLGNLGLILEAPEARGWMEAVRVFASLILETGLGVPVIAYASVREGAPTPSILTAYPDVHVEMAGVGGMISERHRGRRRGIHWPGLQHLREGFQAVPRPRHR